MFCLVMLSLLGLKVGLFIVNNCLIVLLVDFLYVLSMSLIIESLIVGNMVCNLDILGLVFGCVWGLGWIMGGCGVGDVVRGDVVVVGGVCGLVEGVGVFVGDVGEVDMVVVMIMEIWNGLRKGEGEWEDYWWGDDDMCEILYLCWLFVVGFLIIFIFNYFIYVVCYFYVLYIIVFERYLLMIVKSF